MPESAKIFLVDDNKSDLFNTRYFLEKAGHEIIVEATSLDKALMLIPELTEKGVNVAIVDGNLTPGDSSGRDGQMVAREIRKQTQGQGIKIVAYSSSSKKYEYGDIFIEKGPTKEGMREFAKAIAAL